MKVSLRATYGIMAAVDLAMHLGSRPVQAKSIARRQAIPARFLEQVLHGMKKAGLVSSRRGAQGGYVLSKKPSEVSVVEILEALDGPLSLPSGGAGRAQVRRLSKPVCRSSHRSYHGTFGPSRAAASWIGLDRHPLR